MAQPVLVWNSGGMVSLVAMAMQEVGGDPDGMRPAVLWIDDGRPHGEVFRAAADRQASHYRIHMFQELALGHLRGSGHEGLAQQSTVMPLARVQMLLAAAGMALRIGAGRLIWPVQVGSGFEDVARVTETVVLARQLIAAEHAQDIEIDTPLVEMTDVQLLEVGQQMGVPWELGRSCTGSTDEPCQQCAGCARRVSAFREANLEDPLLMAVVSGL